MCWGDNDAAQIAKNKETTQYNSPQFVEASSGVRLTGVMDITAGDDFACALMENGQVRCWVTTVRWPNW